MIIRDDHLLAERGTQAATSLSSTNLGAIPSSTAPASTGTTAAAVATTTNQSSDYRPLFAFSGAIGLALLIILAIISCAVFQRRRRRRQTADAEYRAARDRDPTLTWEEYDRRCKLSLSIIMLEEENQRAVMIRKSLQSKSSVGIAGITAVNSSAPRLPTPPLPTPLLPMSLLASLPLRSSPLASPPMESPPLSPPPRARSRGWRPGDVSRRSPRSQRKRHEGDASTDDKETLLSDADRDEEEDEDDDSPPASPRGPGERRLRRTDGRQRTHRQQQKHKGKQKQQAQTRALAQQFLWELPDGKRCPPAWGNFPWNGTGKDAPPAVPPPSMRTKTPPIWSHPALRALSIGNAIGGGGGAVGLGISRKSSINDLGLIPYSERSKAVRHAS